MSDEHAMDMEIKDLRLQLQQAQRERDEWRADSEGRLATTNEAITRMHAAEARVYQGAAEIAQLRQELVGSVKAETHAFAVRKAEEYLTELQALRDAQARLLTLDRIHFCGDVYVRVADLDAAVKGG